MKKILVFFLALAACASASAATPEKDKIPDEAVGSVVYDLCFRIFGITAKVATATFTIEESEWEGQPAYLSTAHIATQPLMKAFLKPEYVAKAWYSREDFTPLYFTHPYENGKKKGQYEVIYDYDSLLVHSIITYKGEEPEDKVFNLRDGMHMELLTTLNYIRFHDFPEDAYEKVVLLMPMAASDARICPEEDHFLVRVLGKGVLEDSSGHNLLFWRSSDPDRHIVRFETQLGSGTLICILHED